MNFVQDFVELPLGSAHRHSDCQTSMIRFVSIAHPKYVYVLILQDICTFIFISPSLKFVANLRGQSISVRSYDCPYPFNALFQTAMTWFSSSEVDVRVVKNGWGMRALACMMLVITYDNTIALVV